MNGVLRMAPQANLNRQFVQSTSQRGAVLLVSLVMLLILTLIGMSAIGITTLDTKIANNSRDRQMAFTAAESALNIGGNVLSPSQTSYPSSSTSGYLTSSPATSWWQTATSSWWSTNGATLSEFSGRTENSSKPQYVIEPPKMSQTNGGNQLVNDISLGTIKPVTQYYRLTARGVGPGGATVMLQAVYAKKQYMNTP